MIVNYSIIVTNSFQITAIDTVIYVKLSREHLISIDITFTHSSAMTIEKYKHSNEL